MAITIGRKTNIEIIEKVEDILFKDMKATPQLEIVAKTETVEELETLKADAKPSVLKAIEAKIATFQS
jgi:hypothetical protein